MTVELRTVELTRREWVDAGEVFFIWKQQSDDPWSVDGERVSWPATADAELAALLDAAIDADDPSLDDEKPALRRILRKVQKASSR